MVLVVATSAKDLPITYAKINLGIAIFDSILFWLWGYSFLSIIAWILFGLAILRVGIAVLLYIGVQQRKLLNCKGFCFGECILLCLEVILLFFKFSSIGYLIWTLIVIALRAYGIWIIGGFIRTLQNEFGESASFPWYYFKDPLQVQNKSNVSPGLPSASPI